MTPAVETYWLKASIPGSAWTKVTREEWIEAERRAGFRPKVHSGDPAYMTTCATGGFYSGQISGAIRPTDTPPNF